MSELTAEQLRAEDPHRSLTLVLDAIAHAVGFTWSGLPESSVALVARVRLRREPSLKDATNAQLFSELYERLNLQRPGAQELIRLAEQELL